MYRKHYNAIAAALRSGNASLLCIHKISSALSEEYPTFNWVTFRKKALEGETQEQRSQKFQRSLKNRQSRLQSTVTE